MKTFDIVTLGNANIDQFLTIKNDNKLRLNQEKHEICIASGTKILVDDCQFLLGGGASNVAVGLSRLGFKTSLFAEIGDDEFSGKIVNFLLKDNVDLTYLKCTKNSLSSFSVSINFKGERTLFIEHVKREHNFEFEGVETNWLYIGSLGEEWRSAYDKALDFAETVSAKVAFAPGTTQIKASSESINEVLGRSDILLANREEAIKISTPIQSEPNIQILLKGLQEKGPKTVVITDGGKGSYSIDEKGNTRSIGLFPCRVVQKTGAGDAYASGFLGALMLGLSIEEAMRWGAVNASAVIEKVGAQTGLLSKEEIEKGLKEHSDFKTQRL